MGQTSNRNVVIIVIFVAIVAIAGTYFIMNMDKSEDSSKNLDEQWHYHDILDSNQRKYYSGNLYMNVHNMHTDFKEYDTVSSDPRQIHVSTIASETTYTVPYGEKDPAQIIAKKYTYLWDAVNERRITSYYSGDDVVLVYKFSLPDGNIVYVGDDGIAYFVIYHTIDGATVPFAKN